MLSIFRVLVLESEVHNEGVGPQAPRREQVLRDDSSSRENEYLINGLRVDILSDKFRVSCLHLDGDR